MGYKDYYSILGVARTAGHEEIQRAYKRLARKYHPDISKVENAEERFKELGEAYGVLKDEKKRALYDRHGESWRAVSEGRAPPPDAERVKVEFSGEGFNPEEFGDLSSIFDAFFKKGFGQRGRTGVGREWASVEREWKIAGTDHEVAVDLTLEQAFEGGEHEIRLRDLGTGKEQHLKVRVPAGVQSSQRLRLAGQGGKGQGGGPDGDLYLLIHIKPHSVFRLEKGTLHVSLPLSPWEAALGATVDLRTLEETVKLKIPPGSSTGRKIRLRNKGYFKSAKLRGDLYAEVRVDVPRKLTDTERELFKKLAHVSKFRPRAEQGGRS
jgi:curved DNA-binding protein